MVSKKGIIRIKLEGSITPNYIYNSLIKTVIDSFVLNLGLNTTH